MSRVPVRFLERDGWAVAYRRLGGGPPLVLLHATLSSSAQLQPLADRLAVSFTVIAVDRRGSGESRPPGAPPARPIDVAVHVGDLAAVLGTERVGPVLVVGHSYGGCLALEFAARCPDLVAGSWVFEPPYAPVGPPAVRAALTNVARRTAAAGRRGGGGAAAEAFLSAVGGRGAVGGPSPAARQRIRLAGSAALADSALLGLEPDGLERIRCPLVVATGTASLPVYAVLAEALIERVPDAVHEWIDGAAHGAPMTHLEAVAEAIEAFAARSGWVGLEPARVDPDTQSDL